MDAAQRIRVGVDARCLNTDHLRGMGKYLLQVIEHARDAYDIDWVLFGDRPEQPFHAPQTPRARAEAFEFRGYRFHSWEQLGLPLRVRRAGVDVLHCAATTLPLWQRCNTIVTVHDTLLWQSPLRGPYERWYLRTLIPAALKKSAAIITISAQSKRDMLSLWPALEPKVHLIPHGVSDAYLELAEVSLPAKLRELVGGRPYALYIGGELDRKRFRWAVKVFERLNETRLTMAVCGFSRDGAAATSASLSETLRERVRFLPFISEPDMPALYQNAVAVLYPTLYEGFGFPAIEAQAVGTPVLFSALGSLQELMGPAAEVLPSDDMSAWVDTLRRLFTARERAGSPNRDARLWARRFSWRVSAERHVELYRRLGRSGPVIRAERA